MGQDLNKLAKSLANVIDFINDNKLLNDSNKKRFQTLKQVYDDLIKGIDVAKYDFRPLKRDVNGILHPDRLSDEMKDKVMPLLAKFNGALDDVQKDQKGLHNGEKVYRSTPEPKKETPKREPPKKEEPTNPFEDFDTYRGGGSLKDVIVEGYYAVLNVLQGIPTTEVDYFRLKGYFESYIESLISRINDINVLIDKKNAKIDERKAKLRQAISPNSIKAMYSQKLEEVFNKYNMAAANRAAVAQEFYLKQTEVFNAHQDEIKRRFDLMKSELAEDLARYNELWRLGHNYDNERYQNTRRTYAQVREELRAKLAQFPNDGAITSYVARDILEKDRGYRAARKALEAADKSFRSAKDRYDYFLENEREIRTRISQKINAKEMKEIKLLLKSRGRLCCDRNNLQTKLVNIQSKYEKFLTKYQATFDYEQQRATGGSHR